MRFEIALNSPIHGVVGSSVQEGGETSMIVTEFSSSEDGGHFIDRLENLATAFLNQLPPSAGVMPSTIDNLLVILQRDNSAVVYINEVNPLLQAVLKRPVSAGPVSLKNDIAAIARLEFHNLNVPDDVGIVYLFSLGWRKGMFFDFNPLTSDGAKREFDLGETLAWCYERLRLQVLWSLSESDWDLMIAAQWFPFVSLRYEMAKNLIDCIRNKFDLTFITCQINNDLMAELPAHLEAWRKNPYFKGHMPAIERAVERHQAGDYISSTTLLYLRIEGIMKAYHATVDTSGRYGQKAIYTSATAGHNHSATVRTTLLTPLFTRFLQEVYYGKSDASNVQPDDLCRNSIAHGTAGVENHTLKSSLLGLLILDQLFFYLTPIPAAPKEPVVGEELEIADGLAGEATPSKPSESP